MQKLHPNRPRLGILVLFFLLGSHLNTHAYQLMSTNFYIVGADGLPTLKDGNMTIYDSPYSNSIDWHDGVKMANGGENFGIIRLGTSLAVERRQLVSGADTAFFNMWGMQIRNYRFELTMENFNPLIQSAYVWDNYLRAIQPVDFTTLTTVNFSVTSNPASKAAGRFQVIYTTPAQYNAIVSAMSATLPVNITGIQAIKKNKLNIVSWQVENEISMLDYVVEHSTDGRTFNPLNRVVANNLAIKHQYEYADASGTASDYYRIRANNRDSKSSYSKTVLVKSEEISASVVICPNPVQNKQVHLSLTDVKSLTYRVTLVYPAGKMATVKSVPVTPGQTNAVIELPAGIAPGIYQLRFTADNSPVILKSIIVL